MNAATPPLPKKKRESSTGIFRLAFGTLLIGVSVWGIALSREFFRSSIGPGSVPGDSSFAILGAWVAWALFFGPLAVAGVAMVRSTLRKMDMLDQLAFWLWKRAGRPDTFAVNASQSGGVTPWNERLDPHGLESLSAETVELLQRSAARAATILGALAGAFLLVLGTFGLGYLLLFSGPVSSSSIYVPLATGRLTVAFAVFSGMLVLLGLFVLQQTFRKEYGGWLLPLRLFTYMIVRRRAGERTSGARQHLPNSKQHP